MNFITLSSRNGLLMCLFLGLFSSLHSQEAHYWDIQQGARSTLLAGAVTADPGDNSAFFYNPGALALSKASGLSVVGSLYYIDFLRLKNGAGEGNDLRSSLLNGFPQAFSGTSRLKKIGGVVLSYGILTMAFSDINIRQSGMGTSDFLDSIPGREVYQVALEYNTKLREDWGGIGAGFAINERLSIGLSMFGTIRSFKNLFLLDASVFEESDPDLATPVFTWNQRQSLRATFFGLLWKVGLSWRVPKWRLGASITTPRVNLQLPAGNYVSRSASFFENFGSINSEGKVQVDFEDVSGEYRSTWIMELGLSRIFPKVELSTRIAWFLPVSKYSLLDVDEKASQGNLPPGRAELVKPFDARRQVVNAAFGIDYRMSKKFTLLAGFRTDFNYLDGSELQEEDWVPIITTWNLFHLSTGGTFILFNQFLVTGGLNYSFGVDNPSSGLTDINGPPTAGLPPFSPGISSSAQYSRIGLNFGFTYLFSGEKSTLPNQ